MSFCLILLAAGNSSRFKSNLAKPYHKIGGKTLLEITLEKVRGFKEIKKILVVYNKKHLLILKRLKLKNIKLIKGGTTRQNSTLRALEYLNKKKEVTKVLIHDAARPNFSKNLVRNILLNSKKFKAVIPTLKIQDAVKQKFETQKNEYYIGKDREDLFLTQTPQCFNLNEIYNLHKFHKEKYHDDDFSLLVDLNKVKFIKGEKNNFKITDKSDLNNLKNIFVNKVSYGLGFDVHRLVLKKKLYLAGLRIKSKYGTLGHSDGDPVLHAIIDSILGACRLGDIGEKFSEKNKKLKNIRSNILLKKVIEQIKLKGYCINNLDMNIITQSPKIQKHKKKMIENISKLCEISKNQINIKGKTTEKLGVIGKEKAIACEAIISVISYE